MGLRLISSKNSYSLRCGFDSRQLHIFLIVGYHCRYFKFIAKWEGKKEPTAW